MRCCRTLRSAYKYRFDSSPPIQSQAEDLVHGVSSPLFLGVLVALLGLLPPLDVPVVEPGHGDLGDGHLVPQEVQVEGDLLQVLPGALAVLGQELLGLGQGELKHHVGAQPQAHLRERIIRDF